MSKKPSRWEFDFLERRVNELRDELHGHPIFFTSRNGLIGDMARLTKRTDKVEWLAVVVLGLMRLRLESLGFKIQGDVIIAEVEPNVFKVVSGAGSVELPEDFKGEISTVGRSVTLYGHGKMPKGEDT